MLKCLTSIQKINRSKDKYGHLHPHQAIGSSGGHPPPQLQSRQSSSSLGSGGRSSSAGTKPQPLKPRNQFSDPAATGGNQSASCVGTSKSLNSFQRQESAASFHSGTSAQSTQSAPTCPNHAHHKQPKQGGQQITSAQSLHHHMGNAAVNPGGGGGGGRGGKYPHAYDGRSMVPHAGSAPLPPPLPQHGIGKQHSSGHHPMGMLPPLPQQQPSSIANFESCSTQSSSSSASAPPDYATYPG